MIVWCPIAVVIAPDVKYSDGIYLMSETKWECASVACVGIEWEGKDRRYWGIFVHFMGAIVTTQRIAALKSWDKQNAKAYPSTVNLWALTIARMGQAGWELVTVQHPYQPSANDYSTLTRPTPNMDIGIAYFKRPSENGRNVNEPAICIE